MKTILLPLFGALLFASCAPSTPQSRIEKAPEKFERLSPREKGLVQRGELSRGMSKDAVWIAWGSPASSYEGSKNGKPSERWDYTGSRPVYTTNYFGGYSSGYTRWGGHRYPYSGYGFGFGPEVSYIPYTRASVWFVNERVDSWERQR